MSFPNSGSNKSSTKSAQRAAIVCNYTSRRDKKRRDTRYQSDICNVGLCVIGCIKNYHTLKYFYILIKTITDCFRTKKNKKIILKKTRN